MGQDVQGYIDEMLAQAVRKTERQRLLWGSARAAVFAAIVVAAWGCGVRYGEGKLLFADRHEAADHIFVNPAIVAHDPVDFGGPSR